MPSKTEILNAGFLLLIGWLTAALAVLICLVTVEYTVLGSFSWNYSPEVDLLLTQNATENEIQSARIRAQDVADMRIFSEVVVSLLAASFFMAIFVWRCNVKDLASKEKIESEWRDSRKEIKTISDNFSLVTELLVYGLVHLTPLESKKTTEFLQKFRSNDPHCSFILHRLLWNKNQPDFSKMSPTTRSLFASQLIRGILSDFEDVLDGSSLYSEAYYSVCEGSL